MPQKDLNMTNGAPIWSPVNYFVNVRMVVRLPKLINGKRISLIFLVIALIIISFFLINEAVTCDMGNCNNAKLENSNYCNLHTCSYPGCQYCKGKYDDYCFIHLDELSCSDVDCNQLKTNNSDYCFNHTCTKSGCSSKRFLDSEYCSEHQINMREMLPDPSFSFKLDSAGGIVFNFEATNKTERVIKYVRFDVELYNAVGDRIKDDIRRDYSIGVEIIGPVYQNCTVRMTKETIGYCDNCARIEIKDITIIYTDGTSETGRYNYYYER